MQPEKVVENKQITSSKNGGLNKPRQANKITTWPNRAQIHVIDAPTNHYPFDAFLGPSA